MLAAMPPYEPPYGFGRCGCTRWVFTVSADAVAQSTGVGAYASHTKQRGATFTGSSGRGVVDTPIVAFQAVRERADLDVFAIMLRLTKGADALPGPVGMAQALASVQIDAPFAARTAHHGKDDARPKYRQLLCPSCAVTRGAGEYGKHGLSRAVQGRFTARHGLRI